MTRPRNRCDGCRQSLDRRRREHVYLGPILHDSIWWQIADPTEALCCDCMLRRAVERLGRLLTLADLRPCGWNLWDQPHSWFDLFAERESAPPSNLEEWRSVGEPGEFAPLNFPRAEGEYMHRQQRRANTRAEIRVATEAAKENIRATVESRFGGDWNAVRAWIRAALAECIRELESKSRRRRKAREPERAR